MSLIKKSAVAVALVGAVSAQSTSSVVNVFFPDIDNQELIGSVITSVRPGFTQYNQGMLSY